MRPNSLLAGLISPQVLAAAELDPSGPVAAEIRACDCLEIRYDLFDADAPWPGLAARVANLHPGALRLGTIRLRRDGGSFDDSMASMRLPLWGDLLEARVGLHWVDLELECARDFEALKALTAARGTRVLLSQHHFDGIPPAGELMSFAKECRHLGAPGFKIACMSHCVGDTAGLYEFIRKQSKHFELFSAFAMGATGQASRVFSLACGANLTYGAIGAVLAPGQIQVGAMRRLLADLRFCKDEASVARRLEEPA